MPQQRPGHSPVLGSITSLRTRTDLLHSEIQPQSLLQILEVVVLGECANSSQWADVHLRGCYTICSLFAAFSCVFFFFFSQTEFCWTCLLGKIVIPGILYLDGVLGQELALTYTVIIVA